MQDDLWEVKQTPYQYWTGYSRYCIHNDCPLNEGTLSEKIQLFEVPGFGKYSENLIKSSTIGTQKTPHLDNYTLCYIEMMCGCQLQNDEHTLPVIIHLPATYWKKRTQKDKGVVALVDEWENVTDMRLTLDGYHWDNERKMCSRNAMRKQGMVFWPIKPCIVWTPGFMNKALCGSYVDDGNRLSQTHWKTDAKRGPEARSGGRFWSWRTKEPECPWRSASRIRSPDTMERPWRASRMKLPEKNSGMCSSKWGLRRMT